MKTLAGFCSLLAVGLPLLLLPLCAGCGSDPTVADAPDEAPVELTEEEEQAEEAYVRTTRSY